MNKLSHKIGVFITLAAFFTGCAPQALYFNVDVKNQEGRDLKIDDGTVAVFPLTGSNVADSLRIGNAALGLAEKLEQDRNLKTGTISVFSIPQAEFSGFNDTKTEAVKNYDKTYLQDLMLKTDGDIQIFIHNLQFGQYTVSNTDPVTYGANVIVPYSVQLQAYNVLKDSLLYTKSHSDTIYLQILNLDRKGNSQLSKVVASNLPDISRKIGEGLASYLTIQWITQERMLITYVGETSWDKAYELAQNFKWNEAIDVWIPLTASQNPKRSSCAAYNIAVACEMTEQFPLAMEWVQYSLKKFKFKEAEELRIHLQNLKKPYIAK
ncbi:MAG: DUF6340 family protein [Bacteroidales bacterium]